MKLHICDDINHQLEHVVALYIDILDLDCQVNINDAYNKLGDKVVLCGNMNPTIIMSKTHNEVCELNITLVEAHRDKCFILSGDCDISSLTP